MTYRFEDVQANLLRMNAERIASDLGVAANDPMLKRVQQFHAFIATPKGRRLMEEIQKRHRGGAGGALRQARRGRDLPVLRAVREALPAQAEQTRWLRHCADVGARSRRLD